MQISPQYTHQEYSYSQKKEPSLQEMYLNPTCSEKQYSRKHSPRSGDNKPTIDPVFLKVTQ